MKISLVIVVSSLVLAVLMTFVIESQFRRHLSEKIQRAFCWGVLLCCYCVCVGVASLVIGYFFHARELIALAIGVPLGIPVLVAAAKMA